MNTTGMHTHKLYVDRFNAHMDDMDTAQLRAFAKALDYERRLQLAEVKELKAKLSGLSIEEVEWS